MNKLFSKHFFLYINITYNISNLKIFIKKKFLYFSYIRNLIKKLIYSNFYKIKNKLYGYKILIFVKNLFDFNKNYKPIKFKLINFFIEINFLFKKIDFIIK